MVDTNESTPQLQDLRGILEGDGAQLAEFLQGVLTADIADWLQDLETDDAWRVFSVLEVEERAELLQRAEDHVRESLVARMSEDELVVLITGLPADEVADLLALTDEATKEKVLGKVDFQRARGLRELIEYPADSAGGLMTTEFISVPVEVRVGDAIKEIKADDAPGEDGSGVFVVDPVGRPVGYVSDRELLTHSIHETLAEVMETEIKSVTPIQDQEEVAQIFSKYNFAEMPVVDSSGVLIGVGTADDAHDVLEEEAEEDILRLVGTSPNEHTRLPILTRVRHRLPLQGLTVLGGLITAWLLDTFLIQSDGIEPVSETTQLLTFIPIIIGLAGNVGIQSSTVLVRAFATGEVSPEREIAVLRSEVLVGSLIGLVCGMAAALVAWPMKGSLDFGIAVGIAISVAVSWAAFLGCAVPIMCRRTKIDPAIVAGPFLITMSDISGSAIFVGVAHLLLTI